MAAMANKCTNTKSAIQQYPTRTYLRKDLSPASSPVILDARLIDENVIALLQTTSPKMEYSLEEIQVVLSFTAPSLVNLSSTMRKWTMLEKKR